MEHFVHLCQETRFLADAVAEYLGESYMLRTAEKMFREMRAGPSPTA
jgi:hypothetical protein